MRVLLSRKRAVLFLANGRCTVTRGPRLALTSAQVSRAWCTRLVCVRKRQRRGPDAREGDCLLAQSGSPMISSRNVVGSRDCTSEERRSIAKIANARGVVLVVDEPWGAHFGFHPYRRIGGRLARGGRPGSAQDRWSLERFFGSATPRWPSSVGPAIDAVEAVVDDRVRRRDVPRM